MGVFGGGFHGVFMGMGGNGGRLCIGWRFTKSRYESLLISLREGSYTEGIDAAVDVAFLLAKADGEPFVYVVVAEGDGVDDGDLGGALH